MGLAGGGGCANGSFEIRQLCKHREERPEVREELLCRCIFLFLVFASHCANGILENDIRKLVAQTP